MFTYLSIFNMILAGGYIAYVIYHRKKLSALSKSEKFPILVNVVLALMLLVLVGYRQLVHGGFIRMELLFWKIFDTVLLFKFIIYGILTVKRTGR